LSQLDFEQRVLSIAGKISGRPLDSALQDYLNEKFPANGDSFQALADACRQGISEGWLCRHEQGGIKFGRIIKPAPETHNFSVDVVQMDDLAGPHHRHPKGEIDMIIPETEDARFDGLGAGWMIYPADSAHKPTVSGGRAIILYLLPDGAIEFTGQ
jgi:hypothetical protein